jgi:septal ring factor EnvC (AmiA/AmiB activator)
MQIKIDFKSIIILFLLGFCIFFFSMWYLKGTGYKKDYKKLELEFQNLQKTRDSLEKVNTNLKNNFNKIQSDVNIRNKEIKKIEMELDKTKKDLSISNDEVLKNKKYIEETKIKIEKLKKNPIKREDDDLIKSLKEKLK